MRKMTRSEWLSECRNWNDEARKLLKSLDQSGFMASRLSGTSVYDPGYNYKFDDSYVSRVLNFLRTHGEAFRLGVYLKLEVETVLVEYPDDDEVDDWNGQTEEEIIESLKLLSVKELREKTGLSQAAFGKFLMIPQRSIQNWENGVSDCPEYVLVFINKRVAQCLEQRRKICNTAASCASNNEVRKTKVFCGECNTVFEVDFLYKNIGGLRMRNDNAYCPECGSLEIYPDTPAGADDSIKSLTNYECDLMK